jgi:hypothetical protein
MHKTLLPDVQSNVRHFAFYLEEQQVTKLQVFTPNCRRC